MPATSARSNGHPPPDLATVPFAAVAAMDRAAFVQQFGGVFAAGAWVAEAAWPGRPFAAVESLHEALVSVVLLAPRERRLALLRAHPDLAGLAALNAGSAHEPDGAGLHALSPSDRAELLALSAAYRERFGFPFVICARRHTAAQILAAARTRVAADACAEERTALDEATKLAHLRLWELVE
jgi:OHCU decarboxylase